MSEHTPDIHNTAQHLQFADFLSLADTEQDPSTSADLVLAHTCATAIAEAGGQALVVGGFARDLVIDATHDTDTASKDIDIEVYGLAFETMEQLLEQYGKIDLVGQSFGIAKLTNPHTGNVIDFSIPRRDSKVDKGHKGFQVTGDPHMSIEEAARRRDFTMNTLALDPITGELHDWYGAMGDIKNKVLRATDPELFADDPLRVLRGMQFAARFDMTMEEETAELCRTLDLQELSKERIGEEWIKLLTKAEKPSIGLQLAKEIGILSTLHPELDILEQIEQEAEWHPEGNVWNHTMLVVDAAAKIVRMEQLEGDDVLTVLLGALCHDLGKATTTERRLKNDLMRITAYGHDIAGEEPARTLMATLNIKKDIVQKVIPIVKNHMFHVGNPEPNEKQIRKLALRLQPASIRLWDLVCRSDSNGRGDTFQEKTASYDIYARAMELEVDKQPPAKLVFGRDLLALELGLQEGPGLGMMLKAIYEAQINGEFTTVEEGICYARDNFDKLKQ